MGKIIRNIMIFAAVFAAAFFYAKLSKDTHDLVKREQVIMGTVVEIQVRGAAQDAADEAINKAFSEIKRIDALFTTYDSAGAVAKINNSKLPLVRDVDSEVYALMQKCDGISRLTENSFDVSLHELITAWGFESAAPSVPSGEKIKNALNASGWIKVNLHNGMVARLNNVKFNFGAIAKGYAVDRGLTVLADNGITEALINAGGEVKTLGRGWKVGIQDPGKEGITATILLENNSVATSGYYEQYFEENGKRYHHILNPATGYPASGCRSVTVITQDNFFADALATGVFVMGSEKGLQLLEKLPGTEGMIIDSAGSIIATKGFNKYLLR